ncbi:transcriptional regulator [Mycoavidus sp. B2-EB]|nr:response regulator [Mycoavidus sp. B2-EB]BBO60514.1 transcriptional regulator [Mycoavidus sp. B2-EB]
MATILVVDDEMGIRELLSEILNDEGHLVDVAENAQEARAYCMRQAPDLILLDIWMPDTDGITLLKEWAARGCLTMPVIMMSGHATIDTAVEATRIGAFDFLEKPIALQKLLQAVKQGLVRGAEMNARTNTQFMQRPTAQPESELAAMPSLGAVALSMVSHSVAETAIASPSECVTISLKLPLRDARDAFERAYFEYHLKQANGSMTRIAERAGLERTHLYRKLKQLGIELCRNRADS